MKISLNLQNRFSYNPIIKQKDNQKQAELKSQYIQIPANTLSFSATKPVDYKKLEELKKHYNEQLAAAKTDEERIAILNSETGFVPRSDWDSSLQEEYNQPIIHKFDIDEIIEIVENMSSNKARFDILTAPSYVVKAKEAKVPSYNASFFLSGSIETSTSRRIFRAVEADRYKQLDDKHVKKIDSLKAVVANIVKDRNLPQEDRIKVSNFYSYLYSKEQQQVLKANTKNVEFTPQEMKYSRLFLDDKNNLDWNILASSTDEEIFNSIQQLKDDSELSQESRVKILSADNTNVPIGNRLVLASKSESEDKAKHFKAIDLMLSAVDKENQQLLIDGALPFLDVKTENSEIFAKALDYATKNSSIDVVLENDTLYPSAINEFLQVRYDKLKDKDYFVEVYNNLANLDSKLALMAAHYSPNLPEMTIFNYHSKFCLEALNKLETEALSKVDTVALDKIQRVREDLYDRWECEQVASSFEDIKALIENAPSDEACLNIINGMISPTNENQVMRHSFHLMELFEAGIPNYSISDALFLGGVPQPRLHDDFANFDNMKYVLDVLNGMHETGAISKKAVSRYQELLFPSFEEVCKAVYKKDDEKIRENLSQYKTYTNND